MRRGTGKQAPATHSSGSEMGVARPGRIGALEVRLSESVCREARRVGPLPVLCDLAHCFTSLSLTWELGLRSPAAEDCWRAR